MKAEVTDRAVEDRGFYERINFDSPVKKVGRVQIEAVFGNTVGRRSGRPVRANHRGRQIGMGRSVEQIDRRATLRPS
jgi:hypothetical protein